MFRFIHCADAHIDSPLEGLDAYAGAPTDALRGATRRAFENLVDLAVREAVDFILIAGDLYDGAWKDFSTGLFFTRQMVRLDAAGIPVLLIHGNHDAASVLTRRLGLPDNVHAFSTRQAETVPVQGLPVAVHGRGFPQRAVPENLVPEYPAPVSGRFNIGLLHTSLNGGYGHDPYAPCHLEDLRGKGYDYWALGHVHKPQVLAREPWVVYSGNTQGRHVNEAGPRGCRLVEVDADLRVVEAEFRALDVVRWARVPVDLSGLAREEELLDALAAGFDTALAAADGRPLAVRVELSGTTSLHGRLKHQGDWLRAESIAQAQIRGGDAIWVEQVRVDTSPVYDLADLAARDDLTRTVLASLDTSGDLSRRRPREIDEMLKVLPAALRAEAEAELAPDRQDELLSDVRSILLDALARGGGAE